MLVCTWRHGSHVHGQEQKHFNPLGTKLYLNHVILWGKILLFSPSDPQHGHLVPWLQTKNCNHILCPAYKHFGWLPCAGGRDHTIPKKVQFHQADQRKMQNNYVTWTTKFQWSPFYYTLVISYRLFAPSSLLKLLKGYTACLITRLSIASSLITVYVLSLLVYWWMGIIIFPTERKKLSFSPEQPLYIFVYIYV